MPSALSPKTLQFLSARLAGSLGAPVSVLSELLENGDNLEYLNGWVRVESLTKASASPLLPAFIDAAVAVLGEAEFKAVDLVQPPQARPELDAIVAKIIGDARSPAHAMGDFLSRNQGRSVNGWHIAEMRMHRGTKVWMLVPLE